MIEISVVSSIRYLLLNRFIALNHLPSVNLMATSQVKRLLAWRTKNIFVVYYKLNGNEQGDKGKEIQDQNT